MGASVARTTFSMQEMHEKLGHLNMQDVRALAKQSGIVLTGDAPDLQCSACALGKSVRQTVAKKAADRSKREEETIHSDIIPFEVPSISGMQYAVVFIFDKSRFARVYGMKRKSDIIDVLEEFVRDSKASGVHAHFSASGTSCKQISAASTPASSLQRLVPTQDQPQFAPPRTQAHNGIAERWIRSATETMRTILIASGKEKPFWFLALKHATLLRNVSPTAALRGSTTGSTPHEAYTGKPFDISKLHPWGAKRLSTLRRRIARALTLERERASMSDTT